MTRALYHEQGTLTAFESPVLQVEHSEVVLEATAFYPAGGGQLSDAGVLRWEGGSARVLDTRKDKASGQIWHRLTGDVPPVGATVQGELDTARRWRHMQRHSGEHLLAQAFQRVSPAFQVAAVSMQSPECHLDLLGDPGEADVRAAEALLRETLGRQELTLETPFIPETQLHQYPLRRETKVKGTVRLVIFRDDAGQYFDVSACGGTHVPRAAMCAPVVVLRTERIKGGLTRVTFMAGEEASDYLAGVYRQAKALAQGFSVPVERLTERVHATLAERDGLKGELAAQREALGSALLAGAVPVPIGNASLKLLSVPDTALLLPVLTGVASGEVVAAVSVGGRCGVASGLPGVAAGELLREVLRRTGGKGGGKPDLAQGSCEQPEQFLGVVQQVLAGQENLL